MSETALFWLHDLRVQQLQRAQKLFPNVWVWRIRKHCRMYRLPRTVQSPTCSRVLFKALWIIYTLSFYVLLTLSESASSSSTHPTEGPLTAG
jgi:hypothetical protein